MQDILILSFVFLVAGVIAVPIATRLGLGSVLGYLIAGIVISPLLGAFGVNVVSLQHFAEFGVVMMLFLVGLELEPKMLWQMRHRLVGLGGLQVALSTGVVMAAALALGQPWTVALAIGLVLSLSSTAIVLQTLQEKGLMKSDGGQGSFSVLLAQDIAVIPMLALVPLLAMPELIEALSHAADHVGDGHGGGDHGESFDFMGQFAAWQQALITVGAVGVVVVGGSVLTRPLFRFVAVTRLRELFTATALMIVIGIAALMTIVGLSPALGTFLAGVVLANSEYRHELESDIDPFKGLLLGLFFMTVGAGINFGLLGENLGSIIALTLALLLAKGAVLYFLGWMFKINGADRWLLTLGMAQAGEFAFVLLSFTVASAVIPKAIADQILLVVALSMLLTPALFILFDRVVAPRFAAGGDQDPDEIEHKGSVIIAGHGRFGGVINRMLRNSGHTTVVLDFSSAQLEMLRTFGFRAYFGDATRPDLLHTAGIQDAAMLVVAIDDREQITELVHYCTTNYPHVKIVARAMNRDHVYELYAAGCREIIRDTFDSSVRAGRSALQALGMHPYDAELFTRSFVNDDRTALVALAGLYDPDIPSAENEPYVEKAKELMAEQERALKGEKNSFHSRLDRGWTPPNIGEIEAENAS